MGHRAIAVDLPGFGKSISGSSSEVEKPSTFILNLIQELEMWEPVIISPSMSGRYSLPFLVTHPDMVKGYVPIAPVMTGDYAKSFPLIKVSFDML